MCYFKSNLLGVVVVFVLIGCKEGPETEKVPPNILWIYLEDTSLWLGNYSTTLL